MSKSAKILVVVVSTCFVLLPAPVFGQRNDQYPKYHMRLEVDPAAKRLVVSGTVRLPASEELQTRIPFTMADVMELVDLREATPQGATKLEAVLDPAAGTSHYFIQLPTQPLNRGPLELSFKLQPKRDAAFVFATGTLASFADAGDTKWYPQFGASGNGTGTLEFQVPTGYTAIATGTRRLENSQVFDVTSPSRFAFSVAKYSDTHVPGAVPVDGYFLGNRASANKDLESLAAIVANLAREFGPYPYGSFSIVEVPDSEAAGFAGSSSPGMILVTESSLNGVFSLPYYAHELSHQWWGNLVSHAEEDHGNDMLDEALAQYGSLTTVETLQGPAAAEQYRRDGAPNYDSNQCARGYFLLAVAGLDRPLATLPEDTISHEIADAKGFLVYDLLARTIGREHFHDALRSIAHDYAFRSVTWSEFLSVIQKHSSQNLDWFFDQWFDRTGAPEWHSEWKLQGQAVDLVLSQNAPAYRAEIEVLLVGANGRSLSKTISITGQTTTVSIPVDFTVSRIEVDPHYFTVHWTTPFREEATALANVTRANFERIQGKPDEAENDFASALRTLPNPDRWGIGFRAEVGLARVAMTRRDFSAARAHFLNSLQQPVRPPEELPWAYYRLASVALALKDSSLLKWAAAAARSSDSALAFPTGAGKQADALLKSAGQ